MLTLFMEFLPILVKAAQSAPKVIGYIQKTRDHLKETGEWDDKAEAEFNRYKDQLTSQPHWQPESK